MNVYVQKSGLCWRSRVQLIVMEWYSLVSQWAVRMLLTYHVTAFVVIWHVYRGYQTDTIHFWMRSFYKPCILLEVQTFSIPAPLYVIPASCLNWNPCDQLHLDYLKQKFLFSETIIKVELLSCISGIFFGYIKCWRLQKIFFMHTSYILRLESVVKLCSRVLPWYQYFDNEIRHCSPGMKWNKIVLRQLRKERQMR